MTTYFLRRLLLTIPTFIGITLLVFVITRFVPGGPVERMVTQAQIASSEMGVERIGGVGGSTLSADQLAQLNAYYGFDKPVLQSYFLWIKKVVTFDLGMSSRYNEPVWDIIIDRFPISIFYGLATMLITYSICIPLGIIKAIRHSTPIDHISSAIVFVGYAIPNYVFGIVLITLFASHWDIFPLGGFVSDEFDDLSITEKIGDIVYHAVLPLLAYVIGSFAVMTMMMKNSLMDNLAADYVRTAMAKGLTFNSAILKHALRNSLIPLATSFGHTISLVLTGSFLIETVFNIDGMGLLGYESLVERDYPIVLGILVISSLLFLIGNILSDLCVAVVDPRVQFV